MGNLLTLTIARIALMSPVISNGSPRYFCNRWSPSCTTGETNIIPLRSEPEGRDCVHSKERDPIGLM